jgi:uncharacterized protein (TIGR03083 family)
MTFLRVDTVSLFGPLRRALVELLRTTDGDGWNRPTVCPGWTVHDLALHLLGVEVGNVSRRRDRHVLPLAGSTVPGKSSLAAHNEGWVDATRGVSPRLLVTLLDGVSAAFDAYVSTVDLEPVTATVSWAGGGPVPVWLDIAREYTERWVHQQQLREALQRPGMTEAEYVGPVIGAFVHAIPMALAGTAADDGAAISFEVDGAGGGRWHVLNDEGVWDLRPGAHDRPNAVVRTDAVNAWRRFTRHPLATPPVVEGDQALGRAAGAAVAILL